MLDFVLKRFILNSKRIEECTNHYINMCFVYLFNMSYFGEYECPEIVQSL